MANVYVLVETVTRFYRDLDYSRDQSWERILGIFTNREAAEQVRKCCRRMQKRRLRRMPPDMGLGEARILEKGLIG